MIAIRTLFTLPLLAIPTAVLAQGETIVVTGEGLPEAEGDIAYSELVLTDALDVPTLRVEDVLGRVAGFQQFRRADSRSVHPTAQGAGLRGLGGNAASRATVELDGVPLADPFGGWVDWATVDPAILGQVTVRRGGGLGAFSPGALAGAVSMTSRVHGQSLGLRGSAAYGSRDSLATSGGISGPMGAGGGSLSVRYDRGDGFTPIIKSQRGAVDRDAPYKQFSTRGRAVARVSDNGELQLGFAAFDDRRDRGVDFTDNRTSGGDMSLRYVGRGSLPVEALVYGKIRRFDTSFARVEANRSGASQALDQKTPSTGYGGKVEVRPDVGEGIQLRFGTDLGVQDGETLEGFTFVNGAPSRQRRAGGRNLDVGAYVDGSIALTPQLLLTGGVRIDHWRLMDGQLFEMELSNQSIITDQDFGTRSGWQPTGRIGFAFDASETVTLRAAAYNSFRVPTLNELYRPFRVGADGTAANAQLKPEKLYGVEAGLDYSPDDRLSFGLTAYWNRLEDAIANLAVVRTGFNCPGVGFVSGVCRQRGNLDAVDVYGVEGDARMTLGRLSFEVSAAWRHSRIKSDGANAGLDGLKPAQTPTFDAAAALAWNGPGGHRFRLSGKYVGAQFEDDGEIDRLDDYFSVDALARIPIVDGFMLDARVENLTDERIETGISGGGLIERAQPRTWWLGLSFDLN